MKHIRLILTFTSVLGCLPVFAVHGPLGAVLGDNPEKRVLSAENAQSKELLTKGTEALAVRLAKLSLCTSQHAYKGKEASTLEWYMATALSKWNDELLGTFAPSSSLEFDASLFRKTFEAEVAKRFSNAKVPTSISENADYLSRAVKAFTESVHEINAPLGSSTNSFKRFTPGTLAALRDNNSEVHTLSQSLNINCTDVAKGSKFWGVYNFLGEQQALAPAPTLEKRENIVEKIIPGRKPSQSTENLINVAYSGAQLYRNSGRSVIGKKSVSKSLGRCAMYVSIALEKAGCTPEFRAPDAKAYNMGSSLRSYGFTNLMKDGRLPEGMDNLYDTPPGAVLVFNGGDAGHVEFRTKNGFLSDYYSSNPRTGSSGAVSARGRKLIGIYVKPSCGAGAMI